MHPHVPVQDSSFGPLPSDLASAILFHLSLANLLLLKCLSKSVANAVRRTIHSTLFLKYEARDGLQYAYYEDAVNQLESDFDECTLSLPMRVICSDNSSDEGFELEPNGFEFCRGSEKCLPSFVVHEFYLEFDLNGVMADKRSVKEWYWTAVDLEMQLSWAREKHPSTYWHNLCEYEKLAKHLGKIKVRCIQFCIEIPGIGIFHSSEALWDHLDHHLDHKKSRIDNWEADFYSLNDCNSIKTIELALHLIPCLVVGELVFTRETARESCSAGDSLFHLFVAGMIHDTKSKEGD